MQKYLALSNHLSHDFKRHKQYTLLSPNQDKSPLSSLSFGETAGMRTSHKTVINKPKVGPCHAMPTPLFYNGIHKNPGTTEAQKHETQ